MVTRKLGRSASSAGVVNAFAPGRTCPRPALVPTQSVSPITSLNVFIRTNKGEATRRTHPNAARSARETRCIRKIPEARAERGRIDAQHPLFSREPELIACIDQASGIEKGEPEGGTGTLRAPRRRQITRHPRQTVTLGAWACVGRRPDSVRRSCDGAYPRCKESVGEHFPFSRLLIYTHQAQAVRPEVDLGPVRGGGRSGELMGPQPLIGEDRRPHRVGQGRCG